MSRRYWYHVSAIGGLTLALLALAVFILVCWPLSETRLAATLPVHPQENESGSGQETPGPKQSTAQNTPWGVPIYVIEDEAKAEARQRGEDRAERRESDELVAQQSMSDATQRMSDYSFWQTIFLGVGTLLLVGTLWLTAKANRAASDAVKAGMETNRIMREERRPWVNYFSLRVSMGTIQIVDKNNVLEEGVLLHVYWQNFGQTPARDTNIFMGSKVTKPGEAIPAFAETERVEARGGIMGPHVSASGRPVPIGAGDLVRIRKREIRMFVFGRVTYRSTSQDSPLYETEYTGEVVYPGDHIVDGKLQPWVQLEAIGPQNTCT